MDHSRAMRSFYAAIRMIGITLGAIMVFALLVCTGIGCVLALVSGHITLGVGMLVGFMLIIVVLLTIDNYYDRSFR